MDTSTDGAPSPAKGGADSGHTTSKTWRSGWWDFYPILERPRRPIVWSQSSVIFTAHPSQPLITGRHFSSSKQFVLPSPNPVISLPGAYNPPTVISVAPGDDWLFAYYSRNDAEGLGCLWKRGTQLDSWQVKECWPFPRAGGAVTASWLSRPREWVVTPAGDPARLPFRGPSTPVSNPTLVVVTEDNNVIIYFYRYVFAALRSIRRSLLNSGATVESGQNHTVDAVDTPTPVKYCIDAGISIGYNESSIFIASHSFRKPAPSLPIAPPQATPFNSMDLSVPINLSEHTSQEKKYVDFDTWGEDYTVSVHELQLRYDGNLINIFLHHFGTLDIGKASLARINFICAPPPLSGLRSGDQADSLRKPADKGSTYLALTAVDFHSYKAPPTSQLSLFSLVQKTNTTAGRAPIPLWTLNPEATRTFDTGVVVHAESFVDLSSPSNTLIQTFVLNHSGPLPQGTSNAKEVPVGTLQVLNLPDLSDNSKYQPTAINYPSGSVGRELPLFTTLSPNRSLISTLSTSLWKSQITVHTLPRADSSDQTVPHPMASALVVAILAARSPDDVIHCISSPKIPLAESRLVMYQAHHILEKHRNESADAGTWEILGVATEVYRSRSKHATDISDKEGLEDRWRTAHDICSLAACNIAFEDCKEDGGYDLDVAWQLISLCIWVVNFAESLMKVAVLSSNTNPGQIEHLPDSSLLCSPSLLHLAHPFALQNVVVALKHVKAIRIYLGSLPAGGENSQMAQLIITDSIDSCGIDFGGLITILEDALPAAKGLNSEECRKALTNCNPVPQMQSHLFQLAKTISDSETILNKTKLFIKPFDLVDDVARLSFESRRPDEKDVIGKGLLAKEVSRDECLRCGGKTSTSRNFVKIPGTTGRWTMWERMWQVRCICGGPWLSGPTST
ncbi:hypothetical protein CPB83DRAFT_841502 [Crepidotus variabilis]|uniref:Mediator complex subunit 16 n=1 Tax=Crepidotus variabilis TaxID=179855 RepID=A0A9P6EUH3_9AGAR|nr:hypothetical protein CPB83DRAFT_841502 [Crepidotus variabilis]